MPTTAPPPPPPSAVAYPPPPPPSSLPAGPAAPPPAPHKLSTGKIAMIGGGAAAAIGGIVALVVLLGGGDKKEKPDNPKPQPVTSQSPAIGGSTSPGTEPSEAAPTPEDTGGDTGTGTGDGGETTTSGSAIDLGNGVALTPAAGWAVDTTDGNKAWLVNEDAGVVFFVGVGQADSTDPVSVLSTDINSEVQGGSLSEVQVGQVNVVDLGGSVFDQIAVVPFAATQSTDQGTTALDGRFGELINTQTGNSAFVVIKALSTADIEAVDSDITSMVLSMAGAS